MRRATQRDLVKLTSGWLADLRIDFVITELYVGGAERCLTELAIGMAKQGDRVRVASISPLPKTQEQQELVQRLRHFDIETFSCEANHAIEFLAATNRLASWMKAGSPNVVQTMLFHANVIGTIAGTRANVPVRVGGIRVAEPSWTRSKIEQWAMRRMSAAVCVSEKVRAFVKQSRYVTAPLYVIENAIDCNLIDATSASSSHAEDRGGSDNPVSNRTSANSDVLLFVGRLHHQKGLDVLFEALPALLTRNSDMRVEIVGDGPLRKWVEMQADTMGRARIAVLGWRSDVLSRIKGCRMLVLPSRYEGMPNVVLEAMACRRPVAVTNVEGIEELLRDVASKQMCVANDSDSLATLIERIWTDSSLRLHLGARNRAIIECHHEVAAMVTAYRAVYEQCAAAIR